MSQLVKIATACARSSVLGAIGTLAQLTNAQAANTALMVRQGPTHQADRPSPSIDKANSNETLKFGVLGSLGFPRPASIEAIAKFDGVFAIGVEYGALPTMRVSMLDIGIRAIAADVRLFPFRNAFFVGLRGGHQTFRASASAEIPLLGTVSGAHTVSTWFLNPRLGFLWTARWGLSVGFEAGIQMPLRHSTSTTIPGASESMVDIIMSSKPASKLTDTANFFGAKVVPTIALLQIGMMF